MRKILYILLVIFYSTECFAYLGDILFLPPHANYQTIQTEHFKIVFPGDYSSEAERSAQVLEYAYKTLTPYFQYKPSSRTTIILTDNQDYANGATSAIGRQGIVLLLAPPEPYTSIGEYQNWLESLIIHEYTHWLTLDPTRGIFQGLRYIFGDLFLPNHAWPSWLAEGFAVYAESIFTEQGRGYGSYYQTLIRDALLKNNFKETNFLAYSKIFGPYPEFPFGEAAYFFGFAVIDQLKVELGDAGVAGYPYESSYRVPYLLNGTLQNLGGQYLSDLWEHWLTRQQKIFEKDLQHLKARPAPTAEYFTPEKSSALGARISPNGKTIAYYLDASGDKPDAIHIIDLQTKRDSEIDLARSNGMLSWNTEEKESQILYYSKVDFNGPYSFYSDLYQYDLTQKSVKRLTYGQRAKDPDYCNGGTLVYTSHLGRKSELRALNLKTNTIMLLYQAPDYYNISTPRCSHDGKEVYFSEHGKTVHEAVYKISLTGGSPQYLFGGPKEKFRALFPSPTQSGDIIFTQVKHTGYFNLAVWNSKTHTVQTLAQSSYGYWLPQLFEDTHSSKIVYSAVSSQGIQAALIDYSLIKDSSKTIFSPKTYSVSRTSDSSENQKSSVVKYQTSHYNFLSSLAPRVWAPYLEFETDHNQYGAALTGWDDLDQFSYLFTGWYDSLSRRPEGFALTNQRFLGFKLGLGASSEVTTGLVNAQHQRNFIEERKLSVNLARPFPYSFYSIEPSVNAEWARSFRNGDLGKRIFTPNWRLGAKLSWDSRLYFGRSITDERGLLLQSEVKRFFTSSDKAWKALLQIRPVFALTPQHSSLSLNLYGVVSPHPTPLVPESSVKVGGSGTLSDLDPPLRGYPLGHFHTKRAFVAQPEYRIPFAQIFRSWGSFPVFLNNLGGLAFYDIAVIEGLGASKVDSIGTGLMLNSTLGYHIPIQLRLEFAHGLRKNFDGQNIVTLGLRY